MSTERNNQDLSSLSGASSRRDLLRAVSAGALGSLLPRQAPAQKKNEAGDLNVLFIAVDDLRPSLGCYGDADIRTPNIDALASGGLTFTRAYCQQAVCSPSRTSLLTGLRPDTTRVYDLDTHFRRYRPNAVTLPEHFKNRGYTSAAFSKIFHKPSLDDQQSWSLPSWIPSAEAWKSSESRDAALQRWNELQANGWISQGRSSYDPSKAAPAAAGQSGWGMPSWESRRAADNELADGMTADAVVHALGELRRERFFVAAGFLKPHLPFVAPEKYFDLYPKSKIDLASFREPPTGAPAYALHNSAEMRGYSDIPQEGPIPDDQARELIRAYRASVSYVDAQIGKVLDALDDLDLREKTVVVLLGDHGYHLGDHGLWNKHTNFEDATRAPLIVRAPGRLNKGRKTAALTEFVDVYPSLCELCELDRSRGLEGSSFVPLLDDPNRLWKRAAFSQYPREIPGVGAGMGYSIRTRRFRYTEWRAADSPYASSELYDYQEDPLETRNIAGRPENVSLVNGLQGMLREGWRASLPPTEGPV